jgi:hypothetical protein
MAVYVHICVDKRPGLQYFVVSPSPVPCTSRSLSLCASKQASSLSSSSSKRGFLFCTSGIGLTRIKLGWAAVDCFDFSLPAVEELEAWSHHHHGAAGAAGNIILTWSNCSSCCSLQNTARLLFNSFVLIPCPFWFGLVWVCFFSLTVFELM